MSLAIACAAALAGCATHGRTEKKHAGGEATGLAISDANNNGSYVDADSITYQLQISRILNPYLAEDSQYVTGLPKGTSSPNPSQTWFGVFMWARNQTRQVLHTAPPDHFIITDAQGNVYHPITLDRARNAFAWNSEALQPGAIEPNAVSIAGRGFTGGGLLLFKVSESVYRNRPLTLYILGTSGKRAASISLNL